MAFRAFVLTGEERAGGSRHRIRYPAAAVPAAAPAANPIRRAERKTIGYSVDHRAIRLIVIGDPRARHPTLVIGCIHGNEPAGIAIAAGWPPVRPRAEPRSGSSLT